MKIYRPLCACFVALACASVAHAAIDVWDGNGTPDGTWTFDLNWVDNTAPDGADTATFNLAETYTVTLPGVAGFTHTEIVGAITVSAGDVTFRTDGEPVDLVALDDLLIQNGAALVVTDLLLIEADSFSNAGLNGQLTVDDGSLNLTGGGNNFIGRSGGTGSLICSNGAFCRIAGNLGIADSSSVGSTGSVSISDSRLTVDGLSMANENVAGQSATLDINGTDADFVVENGGPVTIGSATNGTAAVNIGTASVGLATLHIGPIGLTTINATGTVTIGSSIGAGRFEVGGDMLVNGGVLDLNNGIFALDAGRSFTAQNNGNVSLNDSHIIRGDSIYTIQSGADFSATSLSIGSSTSGAMTVDGSGSTLAMGNLNMMTIGTGPGLVGTLTLSNSAVATQSGASLVIGQTSFNNTATISVLSNATLNSSATSFTVQSSGTLNIGSGGNVNASGNLAVNSAGGTAGSGADVNINGSGSDFTQSGATTITVGHATSGTGTINIGTTVTGGVLTTGTGLFTINPTGTVTIGSGATTGTLNANGDVLVNGGVLDHNVGTFTLAAGRNFTAESNGNASFTGSHTVNGNSIYTIQSGADFSTTSSLSIGSTTSGTMTIDGSSSTLVMGNLNVMTTGFGPGLVGTLTLSNSALAAQTGATLLIGQVAINNTATLNVLSGATLNSSASSFTVHSTGMVNVSSGGTINAIGNLAVNSIGGTAGSGAEININGSGSNFSQFGLTTITVGHATAGTGTINIGTTVTAGALTTGTGLFTINPTGTVNVGMGSNRGTLNANGNVTINGGTLTCGLGSVFNLAAGKTMTIQNGGSASFTGSYTAATNAIYNVTGGGSMLETTGALTVGAGAQINVGTTISGGTVASASMQILSTGVVTVGSASTTGTLNVNSDVSINGGTADLVNGVIAAGSITLAGGGTFDFDGGTLHVGQFTGDLINQGGTLAPGQSAGITDVTGSYAQQAAGTLEIEIGGLIKAHEYDTLDISGGALLAGTLDVSLIASFAPSLGDRFTILSAAGGISGVFDTELLPALAGGLMFDVTYTPNDVVLVATRLPGDFNVDGTVDAADYVVWRKGLGTIFTQNDYNVWRARFGQTAGSGATANAAVPEPTTLMLIILAATGWCVRRRPAA